MSWHVMASLSLELKILKPTKTEIGTVRSLFAPCVSQHVSTRKGGSGMLWQFQASIDLSDLPAFMVASQNGNPFAVPNLEAQQE